MLGLFKRDSWSRVAVVTTIVETTLESVGPGSEFTDLGIDGVNFLPREFPPRRFVLAKILEVFSYFKVFFKLPLITSLDASQEAWWFAGRHVCWWLEFVCLWLVTGHEPVYITLYSVPEREGVCSIHIVCEWCHALFVLLALCELSWGASFLSLLHNFYSCTSFWLWWHCMSWGPTFCLYCITLFFYFIFISLGVRGTLFCIWSIYCISSYKTLPRIIPAF